MAPRGDPAPVCGENETALLQQGDRDGCRIGRGKGPVWVLLRRCRRDLIFEPHPKEEAVDGTTQAGWTERLEELIEDHVRSLKNDFRRMLDDFAAPEPPDPEPPADLQATLIRLKESVDTILAAQSQREMADGLLDAVGRQSQRAALLLVRGETLCGYAAQGFEPPIGSIESFQTEPAGDEPLARAMLTTQHLPGSALAETVLGDWHGDTPPAQVCLAPVCVGARTVAIVYADSGASTEPGHIYPEAVEILASMAGLFLDRLRHSAHQPRRRADGDAPEPPDVRWIAFRTGTGVC